MIFKLSIESLDFYGSSEFDCFYFIPGVSGDDVSEDVVPDVSVGDVNGIDDAVVIVVIESFSKL